MAKLKRVLVVCVDRDDDLGRKAGIKGPIVGRQENLKAAAGLGVKDPTDSDTNSIFGAIKKYDELKEKFPEVEIATLTGHISAGFEADTQLVEQFDEVIAKFKADGFVLVTDGAEDDQIIPLLTPKVPLISKEMILVKQAKGLESTYFTFLEALKDPVLSKIFFGIPGAILVMYYTMGFTGIKYAALVLGVYLLAKGFGLEDFILGHTRRLGMQISIQRLSFVPYIASVFIFVFGFLNSYSAYLTAEEAEITLKIIMSLQSSYMFFVLAVTSYILARTIDCIYLKRAYKLRKYMMSFISLLLFWFILDTGTKVILGSLDLAAFLLSIVISFAILLLAFRASNFLDVRDRITKLLVGLPVYGKNGHFLGRVSKIDKKKSSILFRDGRKSKRMAAEEFVLKQGKIVMSS